MRYNAFAMITNKIFIDTKKIKSMASETITEIQKKAVEWVRKSCEIHILM